MLSVLMDYYECADKAYGREGFAQVERKRFPRLKEEERLMPTIEFGFDRAKQQGLRQGLRKGKQLGVEQGIEQGIERGIERGRLDTAKRFLLAGVDEEIICQAAQLTTEELDDIKRRLEN